MMDVKLMMGKIYLLLNTLNSKARWWGWWKLPVYLRFHINNITNSHCMPPTAVKFRLSRVVGVFFLRLISSLIDSHPLVCRGPALEVKVPLWLIQQSNKKRASKFHFFECASREHSSPSKIFSMNQNPKQNWTLKIWMAIMQLELSRIVDHCRPESISQHSHN